MASNGEKQRKTKRNEIDKINANCIGKGDRWRRSVYIRVINLNGIDVNTRWEQSIVRSIHQIHRFFFPREEQKKKQKRKHISKALFERESQLEENVPLKIWSDWLAVSENSYWFLFLLVWHRAEDATAMLQFGRMETKKNELCSWNRFARLNFKIKANGLALEYAYATSARIKERRIFFPIFFSPYFLPFIFIHLNSAIRPEQKSVGCSLATRATTRCISIIATMPNEEEREKKPVVKWFFFYPTLIKICTQLS